MVTFCMRCGVSLPPFATILVKDGKEFPSPYYICPACGKSAGIKENTEESSETQVSKTEQKTSKSLKQ